MKTELLRTGADPVTEKQVLDHLRISTDGPRGAAEIALRAAIAAAEEFTGINIRSRVYRITTDFCRRIKTNILPLQRVEVKVDGNIVSVETEGSWVILPDDVQGKQVELEIESGYLPEVLPDDLRAAILMMTGRIFENPADAVEQLQRASINLLRPHRRWGS